MKSQSNKESGFTLVEVLAAFTVLSIVSLAMTSFFTNALSYTKGNQDKTVMINLARNALFYIEKQSFDPLKNYFQTSSLIASSDCSKPEGGTASCNYEEPRPVDDPTVLYEVLNPTINGVQYELDIVYQKSSHDAMINDEAAMRDYLIPVEVRVRVKNAVLTERNQFKVEGYITDEAIR